MMDNCDIDNYTFKMCILELKNHRIFFIRTFNFVLYLNMTYFKFFPEVFFFFFLLF